MYDDQRPRAGSADDRGGALPECRGIFEKLSAEFQDVRHQLSPVASSKPNATLKF